MDKRYSGCNQRLLRKLRERKVRTMFKEKSGVEVLVIGKRLVVFDADANKVGQCKLNNYEWEVKAK